MSQPNRYDFKLQGQRFVKLCLIELAALGFIYIFLHLLLPARDFQPVRGKLVELSPLGNVVILDPFGLNWFVGEWVVKDVLANSSARYQKIVKNREEIVKLLLEFEGRAQFSPGRLLTAMDGAWEKGDYKQAMLKLDAALKGYATTTLTAGSSNGAFGLVYVKFSELMDLRDAQESEIMRFTPPATASVFWTDPALSLIEVLFWAMFGVITNVLVNSANYLKANQYRPAEKWVSYTKLAYGPVLALVFVLAIINGWIDPGYEVRVWTLPLVGFLFGYSARKTANLVDRLTESFLGKVSESIDRGPAEAAAKRLARVQGIMDAARPQDLPDFRQQLKTVSREVIAANVAQKETQL